MARAPIQIIEPVLESDYRDAHKLVEDNLFKHDLTVKDLKKSSSGELLVAKKDSKVLGVLNMRRPGKIFEELPKNHFCLDQISVPKEKIGYIALVSVTKDAQKKGIGKKLIAKGLEYQKKWKAEAVVVHASLSSPGNASEKLFKSFDFHPLKIHKAPWHDYSLKVGKKGFECVFCGNPCVCDELEMVKYLS